MSGERDTCACGHAALDHSFDHGDCFRCNCDGLTAPRLSLPRELRRAPELPRRCAYCGAPSIGYACFAHSAIAALERSLGRIGKPSPPHRMPRAARGLTPSRGTEA